MPNLTKITGLFICLFLSVVSFSQVYFGRIDSVKDAAGVYCTYIGEIKNNKPNGRGMLIYPEHTEAIRHTGFFENGLPAGKGLLLFSNAVTAGNFLNGRPDGRVVFKNETSFGTENFVKGKSNGKVISIKNDNTISIYNTKDGKVSGLDLYVSADGNTIYNKRYVNGTQSGAQIQYQVSDNNLFEGYWKNKKWIKQNIAFKSLLKDKRFNGFKNDKAQGMGIFNKNSTFVDTGFLMSIDGKERYFGLFKDGHFTSGALISGNLSFAGSLNTGKAEGFCAILQKDKSMYLGNFMNDMLNDSVSVFLNIENGTTYIGNAVNGVFEGRGMSSTKDNLLLLGTYKNNMLEGKCTKIYPSGYSITGVWIQDSLASVESVSDSKGNKISLQPATLEEGITILAKHFKNIKIFSTQDSSEKKYNLTERPNVLAKVAYKSLLKLGGSEYDEIISIFTGNYQSMLDKTFNYQDDYFISTVMSGADSVTAMKSYEDLCGQLRQLQITLKTGANPVMLIEKKMSCESGLKFTHFEFPDEAKLNKNVTIQPTVIKEENGVIGFSVVLLIRFGDAQFFK